MTKSPKKIYSFSHTPHSLITGAQYTKSYRNVLCGYGTEGERERENNARAASKHNTIYWTERDAVHDTDTTQYAICWSIIWYTEKCKYTHHTLWEIDLRWPSPSIAAYTKIYSPLFFHRIFFERLSCAQQASKRASERRHNT